MTLGTGRRRLWPPRTAVHAAVDRLLTSRGLALTRVEASEPAVMSTLEVALTVLLGQRGHLVVVQVGANDGHTGDPLHSFVMEHADRTRCLFLEPQRDLIPILMQAYVAHPKATIVNRAVGPLGDLSLFGVRPDAWSDLAVPYAEGWPEYRAPTGIASTDRHHVQTWLANLYQGDRPLDSVITQCKVDSRPLPEILDNLGWDRSVTSCRLTPRASTMKSCTTAGWVITGPRSLTSSMPTCHRLAWTRAQRTWPILVTCASLGPGQPCAAGALKAVGPDRFGRAAASNSGAWGHPRTASLLDFGVPICGQLSPGRMRLTRGPAHEGRDRMTASAAGGPSL